MENVSPFIVNIPSYKEVPESKKNVVFYIIEISKKGSEKWTVEKRFSEFDNLDKNLKRVYGNLPQLPGKSLLTLKEATEIERRREGLEKYVKELVTRTDVVSSDVFKRFLQLDNFAPEISVTPPKHLGDLDGLVLGVRDFVYQPEQKLVFVAISDMSVTSRVDSYLTNMKLPWEKSLPSGTLVTVGAVECYLQKKELNEEIKFDKLWTKTFQSQVICLYWDQTSCNLLIGTDDGTLTILKVSSELNYMKYEEFVAFKLHTARVMGLYYDSISEYAYTVSEDKKFKVFNPRKNAIVADIYCGGNVAEQGAALQDITFGSGSYQLTSLVADKENKRVFISNRSGRIFIYDISPVVPELLHSFQAHHKGSIRGLFFDNIKNYLITANYDDGVLALIDLQKPGKEKYAHNIANLQGKQKARFVVWSSSRAELYSGSEDGSITFWDAKKAAPVYAMRGHVGGVTKLQWLEKSNTLITAGKDKKISFYVLPDEWRDRKLEAELQKEAKIQKQTEAMLNFQKIQQKKAEDSDEDDLAGWAN